MDNEGWINTKRRGRAKKHNEIPKHPRDNAWMEANCPPYPGSAADYQKDHVKKHGRAEGMVNGEHVKPDGTPDPRPSFPPGSAREKAYDKYHAARGKGFTTMAHYQVAQDVHNTEFDGIDDAEKRNYFKHVSDSLLPRQHEDLAPRAERWDEEAYKEAEGRLDLLCNGQVAYHSLKDLDSHRERAQTILKQHAKSHDARVRHAKFQSDHKVDDRKDCWGEPVPTNFKAHTRSRAYELPPEGTFSPRHKTPPPMPDSTDAKLGDLGIDAESASISPQTDDEQNGNNSTDYGDEPMPGLKQRSSTKGRKTTKDRRRAWTPLEVNW